MKEFINRVSCGEGTPSDEFLTYFLLLTVPILIMTIIWAIINIINRR